MMDADIQTIASQTNIEDLEKIKEVYLNNNQDVISTIMCLMEIEDKTPAPKPRTYIDEMREILSEKEEIYKRVIEERAKKNEIVI